jgi:hypothetical protein
MKKSNRKLSLSLDTIRTLNTDGLGAIVAGVPPSNVSFIYSCSGPRPTHCSDQGSGMTCPSNVAC